MSTLRDPLLSTELGGDGEDGKAGEECKDGGRSQRGKRASTSEGGSALRRFTALTQHTLVSRTVGQVRRGAALLEGVVLRRSMSARDDGDEALATMLFDQISGIATSARPDGLLQVRRLRPRVNSICLGACVRGVASGAAGLVFRCMTVFHSTGILCTRSASSASSSPSARWRSPSEWITRRR